MTESKWIDFLRSYGAVSTNDSMYDETIRSLAKNLDIQPIEIKLQYLTEIVENFDSPEPKTVILTGTAGDGKTYYCRKIMHSLGVSEEDFQGVSQTIMTKCLKRLTIIKDLSEVNDDRDLIKRIADSVLGEETDEVFLIAANDGQLIEKLKRFNSIENVSRVLNCIEDLLIRNIRTMDRYAIRIYNLSRTKNSERLLEIVDEILKHEGWLQCSGCQFFNNTDISKRCPIIENKKRLEGELIKNRLINLIELCELNGKHLPIRQLFMLVSNMLLGHPKANEGLLKCQSVKSVINKNTLSQASIYRNVFGENLSERNRQNLMVFSLLGQFGIGTESTNLIDNLLIYGKYDPQLSELYHELLANDKYYGADGRYENYQREYLDALESEEDNREEFLELLKAQKQRLFFTIPHDMVEELKLWNLTTFYHAGEYLEEVHRQLKQGNRINSKILSKIVKGFNRISTGLLAETSEKLVLATSGSYSQVKVSRILEEEISVRKSRGESVDIKLDENNKIVFEVNLSSHPEIKSVQLEMSLLRYEFLCRVADGVLPNSLSRECYEDILAFKSMLLHRLNYRREKENEFEDEEGCSLKVIKLNSEGRVDSTQVEVAYQWKKKD